jgi:hypothetical protein
MKSRAAADPPRTPFITVTGTTSGDVRASDTVCPTRITLCGAPGRSTRATRVPLSGAGASNDGDGSVPFSHAPKYLLTRARPFSLVISPTTAMIAALGLKYVP